MLSTIFPEIFIKIDYMEQFENQRWRERTHRLKKLRYKGVRQNMLIYSNEYVMLTKYTLFFC